MKTTLKERREVLDRLAQLGIEFDDACKLRRIAMTLHRWHELECGDGHVCIEREEQWAIEKAAWNKSDKMRWWDGSKWNVRSKRRTYDECEKAGMADSIPPAAAWRDTGSKPYWVNSTTWNRSIIPDREKGALKRLAKIMADYPQLVEYVQTDPRGASLYVLRKGDVEGHDIEQVYTCGVAIY